MKKAYERPELRTVEIKFGVFGDYGNDNDCGGGDDDNHGGRRHGGRRGGHGNWWDR